MENNFEINGSKNIDMRESSDSRIYESKLISRKKYISWNLTGMTIMWIYILTTMKLGVGNMDFNFRMIMLVLSILNIIPVIWTKFGYEEIWVNENDIKVKNLCFGIGWSKSYEFEKIKDIRININYVEKRNTKLSLIDLSEVAGLNHGYVKFSYDKVDVEFGNTYNAEEAFMFVDLINSKIRLNKYTRQQ